MVSRILKGAAVMLSATAFASTASAGCGGSTYCSSNSYLPSIGSWTANSASTHQYESARSSSASYGSVTLPDTYATTSSFSTGAMTAEQLGGTYDYSGVHSGMSYGSAMPSTSYSYSSSTSYGGMMSGTEADMKYGTGSISSAYEGGDVELYGFSGSTASVSGQMVGVFWDAIML